MRHILSAALLFLFHMLFMIPLMAQDTYRKVEINNLSSDIGVFYEANIPLENHQNLQNAFGVRYASFSDKGRGFSLGLKMAPGFLGIGKHVSTPLAFVYRTRHRSAEERVTSTVYSAAGTAITSALFRSRSFLRDILYAIAAGMFSRAEFSVGLTPGYLSGGGSRALDRDDKYYYGQYNYMEKHHSFTLSLDAGATLCYQIWRMDLKLNSGIHYFLTDNFRYNHIGSFDGQTSEHSTPTRWFATFGLGLAYRF